jgi:hypothetical protein
MPYLIEGIAFSIGQVHALPATHTQIHVMFCFHYLIQFTRIWQVIAFSRIAQWGSLQTVPDRKLEQVA